MFLRQLFIDLSIDFCIALLSLVVVVHFILPKITLGALHCAEKQAAERIMFTQSLFTGVQVHRGLCVFGQFEMLCLDQTGSLNASVWGLGTDLLILSQAP